jgi:hypothetical protein
MVVVVMVVMVVMGCWGWVGLSGWVWGLFAYALLYMGAGVGWHGSFGFIFHHTLCICTKYSAWFICTSPRSHLSPLTPTQTHYTSQQQPPHPLTYSSKTALGTLAASNEAENMPTLLWYEKLLPAFPGCATAVRLYAHANVLTDVVLSDRPPLH